MSRIDFYSDSANNQSTPVGEQNPLPVKSSVVTGPGIDRSKQVTNATSVLMAANATRRKFIVKNDSVVDIWINLGAPAVAATGNGNYKIAANGGYFELDGYSGAVNVISAGASVEISAREW